MIYTYISSKICIARVFDKFNINYSGFINRVPNWIYEAMSKLDIPMSLHKTVITGSVVDFKCPIPPQTKNLKAVVYDNQILPVINDTSINNNIDLFTHSSEKYELSNGYIVTTFETGEVLFHIESLPVEFDTHNRIYFPLIPNNEELLEALDNYILLRLLQRGHKVYNYSLSDNNPFTNPGIAWIQAIPIVRNNIAKLNGDERYDISMLVRSFIDNYSFRPN
jgi:hypothetical protein